MNKKILEKIFLNQFGAIKPPWINKDVFYKLPFNFCDRFCERCQFQKICRVFLEEKKRQKKWQKIGVDPYSNKAVFISLYETLTQLKTLLEKDLERLNIKISKEDKIRIEKEEEIKEIMVEKDGLVLISKKLSYSLLKLLEDIFYFFEENTPKEIEEEIKIINFYLFFFSVKIQRAVLSEIEEKEMDYEDTTFDSKNSAFLSYVSIVKIINALQNLLLFKKFPESIYHKTKKLIKALKNLNELLDTKFHLQILSI
jgi:hypothetical protein